MLTSAMPLLTRVKKKLFLTSEQRATWLSENPEDVSITALNVVSLGLNGIEHLF